MIVDKRLAVPETWFCIMLISRSWEFSFESYLRVFSTYQLYQTSENRSPPILTVVTIVLRISRCKYETYQSASLKCVTVETDRCLHHVIGNMCVSLSSTDDDYLQNASAILDKLKSYYRQGGESSNLSKLLQDYTQVLHNTSLFI